ncbi:hypothetical protein D8666_12725 [Ochrobactrum soli]|nr:hypothetical protein D8666_12725 [[Ochrobactrum] soli]
MVEGASYAYPSSLLAFCMALIASDGSNIAACCTMCAPQGEQIVRVQVYPPLRGKTESETMQ